MSRTYRKPLRVIKENEENFIKNDLGRRPISNTKRVRIKKDKDLYKSEIKEQQRIYNEKLKTAEYDADGKPFKDYSFSYVCGKWTYRPNHIYVEYVRKYCYVTISWSIDQEIEELKESYKKYTRDGHWNETGRNSGFKEAAKMKVRNSNRHLEKKILKDEEYDLLPYPNEHDGDELRWSFW